MSIIQKEEASMIEQEKVFCELWDEEQVEVMKPHSRLYHLEPIGVGSSMVESLTSYITRLAEAHSIHPHALFRNEICPLLLPQQPGSQLDLNSMWEKSSVINSLVSTTNQVVQALERLTLRHDLLYLTMLPWKHTFSNRRLMRRQKAWCPVCYEEWRIAGQVIYDPLLWNLESVTVCSKHATGLRYRCPYPDCARTAFTLHPRAQSGFCPQCNRRLGQTSLYETPLQGEERQEQQQVNDQIGELLSAAYMLTPLPQDTFVSSFHTCMEVVTGGNVAAFARQFDLEQAALWRWQRRSALPQLDILLWLCTRLGISLLQFLAGDLKEILTAQGLNQTYTPRPEKQVVRQKRVDHNRVKQALAAFLVEEPPPSLREVSRRVGHSDVTLYILFSELSCAIGQRYRAYQSEQGEKWMQRVCDEVREAAKYLYAQGHHPSERAIKKMITTRGAFKLKAVREARKNILRELELTD